VPEPAAPTSATDPAIRLVREEFNRVRGRMFQAIEAVGLPDKQERAMKGLVRSLTYDAQAGLESILRDPPS
jgi:hypothetical protein